MQPISIVIPMLNEEKYIPRLLDSIVRAKYPGELEVIVVDGGSADKTCEVVEKYTDMIPCLKLLPHDRGTSKQRNHGANKATHKNLIFLDADTEISSKFLTKCSEYFSEGKEFYGMPLILPYDGKLIDYTLAPVVYLYAITQAKLSPILTGMCMITTKSVHDKIGGFNESMRHAEDLDYGLKAFRAGVPYRLFLGARIRASARRLNQMGRINTMRAWLDWHKALKQRRPINAKAVENYSFGDFSEDK